MNNMNLNGASPLTYRFFFSKYSKHFFFMIFLIFSFAYFIYKNAMCNPSNIQNMCYLTVYFISEASGQQQSISR